MTNHPTGADNSAEGFGAIEALPRAYRIADVCKATGLGRTSVYEAITSGELVARKWNRRTIVLAADLATFLNNLPKAR
ncbi:MAG: helix-turn-helix domain-containing protein [Xanthobacteraceae bacterium]